MALGLMLVALALGYKVYADASREKEGVRLLGQVLGIFIMITAFAGFLCGVAKCMSGGGCPVGKYSKQCPPSGSHDAGMKKFCAVPLPSDQ